MIIQFLGWVGALLLIISYALVSLQKIKPSDNSYQFANIFGAVLLGYSSYLLGAWFSVGLNVFWVLVGVYSITVKK